LVALARKRFPPSTHHILVAGHRAIQAFAATVGSWLQVLRTPPLRYGRKRCIRLLRCKRLSQRRHWRDEQEDAMEIWTFNELLLMTREELCDLNARLERELSRHETGSVARADLLASLKAIRKVMVLRGLHF
jgi:hypothetical protein